ncbi:MAG: TIM-barrel domain-containing protein [Christensenellales bacterium]|jgi:alpha-D-xyloside xylohydrolase
MRITDEITRIVCSKDNAARPASYLIQEKVEPVVFLESRAVDFESREGRLIKMLSWELNERELFAYIADEKVKIVTRQTADGERSFVEGAEAVKIGEAFSGKISFQIADGELIFGLGQNEHGLLSHRNEKEYLYQNNMKIPMPVFVSSNNYAVFFDANCLMTYEEKENIITIEFDAIDQIDYYIITGKNFDDIIAKIRRLTGAAALLPRWAFGYIQSRERYKSQDEILETVEEFEKRDIPLSCIILDWLSWEEGKWGNKILDKSRFPNFKGMMDRLHEKGKALLISVWPNMHRSSDNNAEMLRSGKLLANLSTYDAFDEDARKLFWKQCEEEIFSGGVDGWWCDSTEPFTPDWQGTAKLSDEERYLLSKESLTKYFDPRNANAYALFHAKGMYENQRNNSEEKRVVNLTRSGYPSIQKYGAILWSGDIMATWKVFKDQLAEGLNMCISGIPYWTLDIGAFFAGANETWRRRDKNNVGDAPWFWQGDFEQGVFDYGYRELYTRWLQMGTFLPIMRSHGTDTPREPWQFGDQGEKYYDSIVKYIKLRHKLLPYSYSMAAQVYHDGFTMMRSLAFDFAHDEKAAGIDDQFMYGRSFLACPVFEPMEFGPNNQRLDKEQRRDVYLPKLSRGQWYDYYTKEGMASGQSISANAPVETMPLYVKAGSIIPMASNLNDFDSLEIYSGADGEFKLYFDSGDDYTYEKGNYAFIKLEWKDDAGELRISHMEGDYPCSCRFNAAVFGEAGKKTEKQVEYSGGRLSVRL